MTPVEIAKTLHIREDGPRSFLEDLEAHLIHGLVMSTPTAFIMARYVCRDWPGESIINPWVNDPGSSHIDTLHIYLAAGDISEFFTFPHRPCRWISFERRNILRFHSYDTLKRRCTTNSTAPISLPD